MNILIQILSGFAGIALGVLILVVVWRIKDGVWIWNLLK